MNNTDVTVNMRKKPFLSWHLLLQKTGNDIHQFRYKNLPVTV